MTVVSSTHTYPSMVADALRRKADHFIELEDIAPEFTRSNATEHDDEATYQSDLDYVALGIAASARVSSNLLSAQDADHGDWYNGAVPAFGDITEAEILIVGLAPGLKGANATGRPFTGDFAGDTLYDALLKFGLPQVNIKASDDGVRLHNLRITNAVKCVPPQNKPTADEVNQCRDSYLIDELKSMTNLKGDFALGGVAHKALIKTYDKTSRSSF